MFKVFLLLVLLGIINCENRFNNIKTVDEYMNLCIDSKSHKRVPSEEKLAGKCSAWSGKTCCAAKQVDEKHMKDIYKFNYNHCHVNMSSKCRKRFEHEWCFFECSPHMGPWMVKVSGWKTRKERFFKVPLCHNSCVNWWNDCKDDWTCIRNWSSGFKWSKKGNTCPKEGKCKRMHEIYRGATDFCQAIWDDGWVVANSTTNHCFVLEFSGPNPNGFVAKAKAEAILSRLQSGGVEVKPSIISGFIAIFLICLYSYGL